MTSSDVANAILEEVDTNRDGSIDKNELRNWVSKSKRSSPYESSTYRHDREENTTSRYDRSKYQETTGATSNFANETEIKTNSSEETKRYLERSGSNIYIDPNPQIIRRATSERPLTMEQRIFIRCLQPPPLSQEPLIIKEVRPEQPPPPSPLVIREQTSYTTSQPPIILRERPPTPPSRTTGGTEIRRLSPVPVPPRSLVIERFPPAPEKPRDIIIERWIPYESQQERRTVVQRAPPPIKYPAPTHTVIVYDAVQSNIVRKLERQGVTQEDPAAYVARYGASLLDSATLLREARKAGVTEDISCTVRLSSTNTTTRGRVANFDQSSDLTNQGFSSSSGFSYERSPRVTGTEAANRSSSCYSSSASHYNGNSALAGNGRESRSRYHVGDVGYSSTNIRRDGELNQREYQRYI